MAPTMLARILLAIFLGSALGCQQSETLVLQREWVANAEFAGDVWASVLARSDGRELRVREGSEVLDPVKLVRTGEAQFGVASSDRILRENETGAQLAVVAAATWRSPVVFLARANAGIENPSAFRGRTVGIQSGTNTELVFDSLLASQGLSRQEMRVVESGWGTATFETGVLDVLAAFDYDEPVQLTIKKIPFTPIYPSDYGVDYIGTVYFVRKAFADENPEVVQRFMNYLIAGWRQALADPEKAVGLIAEKFPNIDADKELVSFRRGIPYFSGEGGRLLYASRERWVQMANDLIQLKKLRRFRVEENVDYRFLQRTLSEQAR